MMDGEDLKGLRKNWVLEGRGPTGSGKTPFYCAFAQIENTSGLWRLRENSVLRKGTAASAVPKHDDIDEGFTGGGKTLVGCSPGLQSGEAGFQTRLNIGQIKFGALALVGTSKAVCDFSRSLFSR